MRSLRAARLRSTLVHSGRRRRWITEGTGTPTQKLAVEQRDYVLLLSGTLCDTTRPCPSATQDGYSLLETIYQDSVFDRESEIFNF